MCMANTLGEFDFCGSNELLRNRSGCRQASSWRLLLPVIIAAKMCASVEEGELSDSQATTSLERCATTGLLVKFNKPKSQEDPLFRTVLRILDFRSQYSNIFQTYIPKQT